MRWTTTHDGYRVPFSVLTKGGPSVVAEFWDGVVGPRHYVSTISPLPESIALGDKKTGVMTVISNPTEHQLQEWANAG